MLVLNWQYRDIMLLVLHPHAEYHVANRSLAYTPYCIARGVQHDDPK